MMTMDVICERKDLNDVKKNLKSQGLKIIDTEFLKDGQLKLTVSF